MLHAQKDIVWNKIELHEDMFIGYALKLSSMFFFLICLYHLLSRLDQFKTILHIHFLHLTQFWCLKSTVISLRLLLSYHWIILIMMTLKNVPSHFLEKWIVRKIICLILDWCFSFYWSLWFSSWMEVKHWWWAVHNCLFWPFLPEY